MKTTIQYIQESSLRHPDCPVMYSPHDTATSLSECPFPLETENFKVLIFGNTTQDGKGIPGAGRFAVVEYVKGCGHRVQERIAFFEGVEDFEHYGKKFRGKDYSIESWESRIAFFRAGRCDVCNLFEHCHWAHFHAGERAAPKKKTLERFRLLMNSNFGNWQEFVSEAEFHKTIGHPENVPA